MNNQRSPKFFYLKILLSLAIGFSLTLPACQPSNHNLSKEENDLMVTVSIVPQTYFVKRIGGESIGINIMVQPGEEAHTYEPKPEQMKALSQSQIFFSMGVEYEKTWIPRFKEANPDIIVVDTAAGIQKIEASESHSHLEEHGDDHIDEDAKNLDPHVWLAPNHGKVIAENILLALIQIAPDHADTFQANYIALIEDIDLLDAKIQATLSDVDQQSFMVFHPAWGYFAEQYGLKQIPVQVGGQDPSASELAELVKIARDEKIRVIFIQPTFSTANIEALAQEIDAEIALVDPLAEDWLNNLEEVARAFAQALKD